MSLLNQKQNLPAGISDKSGEFYVKAIPNPTNPEEYVDEVFLSYNGNQYSFDDIPSSILAIIHEDMDGNPTAMNALIEDFKLLDLKSQTRQYIACRHGSFDLNADFCEEGKLKAAEYVNCGRRCGACKSEGKLCTALQVKNGYLNENEIKTLTCIGNGLIDKEIEDVTGFSVHTIRNYKDSISKKTGLERKPALAGLAYMLGLVTFNY